MAAAAEFTSEIVGGARVWRTGRGPAWVGLAGPPASALLFRHLAAPVVAAGYSLVLPELFHPAPPDGRVETVAARLAEAVPGGALLLAHGLALPAALGLLARVPFAGLVVISGPTDVLDPVTRAVGGIARHAPRILAWLLRPGLAIPALASSAGLRRTVTNPYAMDRDTVAMLSAPTLATPEHRRVLAEYLGDVASGRWRVPSPRLPVLEIRSASDLLYPAMPGFVADVSDPGTEHDVLEEGRFYALEERPWAVAEAVLRWADRVGVRPTTTEMS
jgi:hypothetical protein